MTRLSDVKLDDRREPLMSGYLEVHDDSGGVLSIPLEGQHLVIGRSSQVEVRLNSPLVSRRHAELFVDPFGRWWIRDLESRNGTKLNDEPVSESVLRIGDVLSVGQFTLKLCPKRDSEQERSTQSTTTSSVQFVDAPDTEISMLAQYEAAKIDMSHLATLTEFGHRLMEAGDLDERRRLLCRLMLRKDFHAQSAVVLRVEKNSDHPPQIICQPQHMADESDSMPYVSRKLLNSIRKSEAPVLASTSPQESGALEMTITSSTRGSSVAAIGCPIYSSPKFLDILYTTFPAEYGSAEWLALVALAAQQYQQTESLMTARRQAEVHAAIEQDLGRARQIQTGLVPRRPKIQGLDVGIGFEPCRWVGGDYADVVTMADSRVLMMIADVSGKGLPAALVTSSLHTMVHATARANVGIRQMMIALNDYLREYLDDRSFVTAIALVIDPATGSIECVNAGHPPALVVTPAGDLRELQSAANLPLGICEQDMVLEEDSVEVGHLLAMFTDGLTEMTDKSGKMLEVEGVGSYLKDIYTAETDSPIHQICDKLSETLDKVQAGSISLDDRTFLLLRRRTAEGGSQE